MRDEAAAASVFLEPMPILLARLMRLFARILRVTGFSYDTCVVGAASAPAPASAPALAPASDTADDNESLLGSPAPSTPNSDLGRAATDLLFAAAGSLFSCIGVAPVTGEHSPLGAGVGVVVAVSDVDLLGEACDESCVRADDDASEQPHSVTHTSVEESDTGEVCEAGGLRVLQASVEETAPMFEEEAEVEEEATTSSSSIGGNESGPCCSSMGIEVNVGMGPRGCESGMTQVEFGV